MSHFSSVYFGCIPECFDVFTLSYRWFGAIWRWEGKLQLIEGYWFGDSREEVVKQVGAVDYIEVKNKNQTQCVYDEIRAEQKRQDWEQRSKLPLLSVLRKPWRETRPGWYIHRSRPEFPLVATCLHRTRFGVWIEHVGCCEHKRDLDNFIHSVNQKHGIQLKSTI